VADRQARALLAQNLKNLDPGFVPCVIGKKAKLRISS